jgi:hypothetical protein
MNTSTGSLSKMINSSIVVLTKPSIASFEMFERDGGLREGLIYVGVAAAIAGIVGFVFGLLGGISAAIGALLIGILSPLIGYLVFASLIYFIGRQQGGTGTQDEVYYSTALYTAPLLAITGAISAIPLLGCLLLPVTLLLGLYQIYLGYLATRSSMNLDQTKGIITVVLAFVAQLLIGFVVAGVLTGIGLAAAR